MGTPKSRGIELSVARTGQWSKLFPELPKQVQRAASLVGQLETEFQLHRDAIAAMEPGTASPPSGFSEEDFDLFKRENANLGDIARLLKSQRDLLNKRTQVNSELQARVLAGSYGAVDAPSGMFSGLRLMDPVTDAAWSNPHSTVHPGADWIEFRVGNIRYTAVADRLEEKARDQIQGFELPLQALKPAAERDLLFAIRGVGRSECAIWVKHDSKIIARSALTLGLTGALPMAPETDTLSIPGAWVFFNRNGWAIVRISLLASEAMGDVTLRINAKPERASSTKYAGEPPRGLVVSRLLEPTSIC